MRLRVLVPFHLSGPFLERVDCTPAVRHGNQGPIARTAERGPAAHFALLYPDANPGQGAAIRRGADGARPKTTRMARRAPDTEPGRHVRRIGSVRTAARIKSTVTP